MARHPHASETELAGLWSQALGDYRAGRWAEAAAGFEAILARQQTHAPSWHLLGLSQFARGDTAAALGSLKNAVDNDPKLAQAHNDLGVVLQRLARQTEAIAAYRRAIALAPDWPIWHYNLGSAFEAQEKFDDAIAAYRRALELKPDYPDALNNLANVLLEKGRPEAAVELYRRAIELNPTQAETYSNLGNLLMKFGRCVEAMELLRRALELKPDYAGGHVNLANAFLGIGRTADAMRCCEQALTIEPDYAVGQSNRLFILNYRGENDQHALYAAHRTWGEARAPKPQAIPFSNAPEPGRRLRVGYVSPDFYTHSVAYFFEPLLAAHDRHACETYCYAHVQRPDATTARLKGLADHWTSTLGMPDAALAERIRADRIDILVDLAGHTAFNRLRTFALKPAPVAVTWCGYPNTTGLAAIDYRVTDALADPVGDADRLHTERLVRLPTSFLCYRPPEDAPPVAPLPARANGHVTFGTFNNLAKVTPETVRLWARVLQAVPSARLILKAAVAGEPGELEQLLEHFIERFAGEGVARERLTLLGRAPRTKSHLDLYRHVDIALDPFPYGGTATTCEALWMGVPVVTLKGDRHAGRVGVSLLTNAGLPELVAASDADYVARAAGLARDLDRLDDLRATLRARVSTSPLCDGARFSREMEAAYRSMWRRWCGERAA